MKTFTIVFLLIVSSSSWAACKFEDEAAPSFYSKEEVEELLKSELKKGATKEEVVTILDQ